MFMITEQMDYTEKKLWSQTHNWDWPFPDLQNQNHRGWGPSSEEGVTSSQYTQEEFCRRDGLWAEPCREATGPLDHAHFGWDVPSKTPKVKIISGSLNCKHNSLNIEKNLRCTLVLLFVNWHFWGNRCPLLPDHYPLSRLLCRVSSLPLCAQLWFSEWLKAGPRGSRL